MLAWTIYLSFLGALASLACRKAHWARALALVVTLACFGLSAVALAREPFEGVRTITRVSWIPFAGISYHLAADGITVVLVFLAGLASVAGVLFSWNINERTSEFFALYLALIGGVYGVFLSFDLFLLFVFYEIAIIPKYFLIAIWGSTRREYAAMKLALYSFAGSAMVLAGIVVVYVLTGASSLNLDDLLRAGMPRSFQLWLFPLVFIGFGVLAGIWPLHTWAPTGHVAAPTAASMLLAGVVMKLGAYGCLRVALPLFPEALKPWEHAVLGFTSWLDLFALLAVIGIVYGALVALVQNDFKFVIGYSSVSHMGFVLLGLCSLHETGLSGAVLQMFSHGVIAGLLFAVVGRMVYDRTHTRELAELGPFRLGRVAPFTATVFVLAALAGMGMPGFSGFVAELQVLIGTWHAFPTFAILAGAGVVVAAAYSLRAIQKGFFAGADGSQGEHHSGEMAREAHPSSIPNVTFPERLGAGILLVATVGVGLWPDFLLRWIVPAFQSPFFEKVLKGGAH